MYFDEKIPYDYHQGFGTAPVAYPIALMNDKKRLDGSYVDPRGLEPLTFATCPPPCDR